MKHSVRRPLREDEQAKLNQIDILATPMMTGVSNDTFSSVSRPKFLSPLLSRILFHRGITDAISAQKFLAPNYDRDTHDPFLLKDAEKAADRIIKAIKSNQQEGVVGYASYDGEKIAIYSDYDADGIPGAAMFHDFFKRIGFKNFIIYIPHRHNEGFGVNSDAIDELAEKNVKLIVTLDCGITDVEPMKRAKKLGIDVIITDHHEPPVGQDGKPSLPLAFAIIDHKQLDCTYPDKNLCGSGVAYKLIQAILQKDRLGLPDNHEKWLLDLVGMATLSDMVPLVGENRVFAHYGMMVLRKSPRKGLKTLLAKLRISQPNLCEDDIVFMITPRINAASRMGVPMDAFDLLVAETDESALLSADHLDHINNERKGVVASLVKEIKKTVRDRHGIEVPSVIVLGNPDWRPSLLGLAANSCAQEFDRPVFLWGRDGDNLIKGSCRSEGKTSVVELMRALPVGVLSQFGGHKHSGGFAVSNEEIHYFEQKMVEAMDKIRDAQISASDKSGEGTEAESDLIDAELSLNEISMQLFESINQLAPFGMGNPKPIFLFKNVKPSSVRKFGKGSEHIEFIFNLTQSGTGSSVGGSGNYSGGRISAISFFGAEEKWANETSGLFSPGVAIDLVASLEKSMYRGRAELRLRVVDVLVK